MVKCPHCGTPNTASDAPDGRCVSCGTFLGTISPDIPTIDLVENRAAPEQTPDDYDSRKMSPDEMIKPRKLSSEFEQHVTSAWQATLSKSTHVDGQHTLNASSSGTEHDTKLNLGRRTLGEGTQAGLADYELEGEIDRGAMGIVWNARQAALDRYVAVKTPIPGVADTEQGKRRFVAEVVVTGKLDHPNIVPIYDLGKDDAGQLFYSMKRVEGQAWNKLIGNLSLEENLEILMKVCDAIRFAHSRGFLHRDIKPHNVMVGEFGEVSVMDWGIAISIGSDPDTAWVAQSSGPAGTPAYMAPEMAAVTTGQLEVTSDVYLLGAVLYQIITGHPPHPKAADSNSALIAAVRNEIVGTDKKGELVDIARRAMATEPLNRYQDVQELKQALLEYQSHAESVQLTEHAQQSLTSAENSQNYTDYQQAVFGFQNALDLWSANKEAVVGLSAAQLAYAQTAANNGDFRLGLDVLDHDHPDHRKLIAKLDKGKQEADLRQHRLQRARRIIIWGTVAFLALITYFYWRAQEANIKLETANIELINSKKKADASADEARESADEARESEKDAKISEEKARKSEKDAKISEEKARDAAKRNMMLAQENRVSELRARASERTALQESYRSEMSLAAKTLQRNDFQTADKLLTGMVTKQAQQDSDNTEQVKAKLRHWEWGHLRSVSHLEAQRFGHTDNNLPISSVESADMSENWIVGGTRNGQIYAWNPQSSQRIHWSHGTRVYAVSVCETGGETYVASSGRSEHQDGKAVFGIQIRRLDPIEGVAKLDDRKELLPKTKANERVVSTTFSKDGQTLLVGFANAEAGLLDWQKNLNLRQFFGHLGGAVWSARFSTNEKRVVTAGEDGTVRIWSADLGVKPDNSRFELAQSDGGHVGAVYTAAFSPNGESIVSGGEDRRLLVWKVANLETKESRADKVQLILESPKHDSGAAEDMAQPLGQHDAAVRSVSFARDKERDKTILMSAGDDNVIKIWDFDQRERREPLKVLRGHGGRVSSITADEDGTHLLSAAYDGRVLYWDWQTYREPLVLTPKPEISTPGFNSAVFSPDEQWVVAAATDGTAVMWDVRDPQKILQQTLTEGHDWLATRAIVFNGGERLLTAAGDNTARIWNAERGNELLQLGRSWYDRGNGGGTGWRGVAAVSHDGQWVATGSDDGDKPLKLWRSSAESKRSVSEPEWALQGEARLTDVTAIAFSPDDRRLLVGDESGACYLIDRTSGNVDQRFLRQHRDVITAAAFLPKGRQVLTASRDGTAARWDIATGNKVDVMRHHADVLAMDVSPDGTRALTASALENKNTDGSAAVISLWDLTSDELEIPMQTVTRQQLATAHNTGIQSDDEGKAPYVIRSVKFSPDAQSALITVFLTRAGSSAQSNQIGSWDLAAGYQRMWKRRSVGDLASAIYGSHASIITVGGKGAQKRSLDGRVQLMNFRPQREATSASFSADGKLVAIASVDGSVKLWRWDQQSRQWLPNDTLVGARGRNGVNCLAFHPSRNDQFLTASNDGHVKLWQLSADRWTESTLIRHGKKVNHVAFSTPDGSRILSSADDGVRLWNTEKGGDTPLPQDGAAARCGAFSGDGRWAVTASGRTIHLWDVEQEKLVGQTTAHAAAITSVTFSHDGRRVLTASEDYTIKLWDTRELVEGKTKSNWEPSELLTLEGHRGEVRSVSFSPNGRDVLSAGRDKQVIIWRGVAIEPSFRLLKDEIEYELGSAAKTILNRNSVQISQPTQSDFSSAKLTVSMDAPYPFADLEQLSVDTTTGWRVESAANGRIEFGFDGASDDPTAAEQLVELLSHISYEHDAIDTAAETAESNRRRTVTFELRGVQYDHQEGKQVFDPIIGRVTISLVSPEHEGLTNDASVTKDRSRQIRRNANTLIGSR